MFPRNIHEIQSIDLAAHAPTEAVHKRLPSINLLGVRLSAVNLQSTTHELLCAVRSGRRGYVCIRDAHGIVLCQRDATLRGIHNRALMVTPDGMPLVWSLRAAGHGHADRVYGPDLMLAMFRSGQRQGLRHYLYGATPGTLEKLQRRLQAAFPAARIVGNHAPPFRPLTDIEREVVVERINRSCADVVWVGLGTPKQEFWMDEMHDQLDAPLLIGVGAAFDIHAGNIRQAPSFIQRSGFEWLFRLLSEPRRLGRRYAITIPAFTALALAQAIGLRSFPLEPEMLSAALADVGDATSERNSR